MSSTKIKLLDLDESKDLLGRNNSPFIPGMRIHCPLKRFQPRKLHFCLDCEFFNGIITTEVSLADGQTENDTDYLTKKFRVFCGHPMSRRITFVPED